MYKEDAAEFDALSLQDLRAKAIAGLGSSSARLRAWPRLLGVAVGDDPRDCAVHPNASTDQIRRDVQRGLTHYVHTRRQAGSHSCPLSHQLRCALSCFGACIFAVLPMVLFPFRWENERRDARREEVSLIVNAVVRKYGGLLHYYQGFHDVVGVFLLVTRAAYEVPTRSGSRTSGTNPVTKIPDAEALTFAMVESAALTFFRDAMRESFRPVSQALELLPLILRHFSPETQAFIDSVQVEPFYAFPWYITWFSHDVSRLEMVARLFDTFLASHPIFILYVCAALVASYKKQLLECEFEFAAIHNFLSSLPQRTEASAAAAAAAAASRGSFQEGMWEVVLSRAREWFKALPPEALLAKAKRPLRREIASHRLRVLDYPPFWERGVDQCEYVLQDRDRTATTVALAFRVAPSVQWRRAAFSLAPRQKKGAPLVNALGVCTALAVGVLSFSWWAFRAP